MRAIWLAVSIAALSVAGVAVLELRFEHHVVNTGYGIYVLRIDRLARNVCAISTSDGARAFVEAATKLPICEP